MHKNKVVFVDHSYHKKTHSGDFLRDALRLKFDLIDLWDDKWGSSMELVVEKINSFNADFVVFFQSILSKNELIQINAPVIWVPMYDAIVNMPSYKLHELSTIPIKIISFSKNLTKKFRLIGFDVFEAQYYHDPTSYIQTKDYSSIGVFLWQRQNLITYSTLLDLLKNNEIKRIILRINPDPGYKMVFPISQEIKKHNITIVKGHISRDKYISLLDECNVYIAPRKIEGIGHSFLEAMAKGMIVVAYNQPTMNEYIVNGVNGFLFSDKQNIIFDKERLGKIGKNARETSRVGFFDWVKNVPKMCDYISEEKKFSKPKLTKAIKIKYLYIVFRIKSVIFNILSKKLWG